jgi:hypothetical protein
MVTVDCPGSSRVEETAAAPRRNLRLLQGAFLIPPALPVVLIPGGMVNGSITKPFSFKVRPVR